MYICVKFHSKDLNPDPYLPPQQLINTYTCRVTIAPRVRGSKT